MRRSVLLLVSGALAVLLASGVALAATINCVAGEVFCVGTKNDDTLNGSEEREELYGLGGIDQLFGNGGDDEFFGGKEADTIRGGSGYDRTGASGEEDAGADRIYGEADVDNLIDMSVHRDRRGRVAADKNLVDGGPRNDYLGGGSRLYGGDGNDELRGYSSIRTKRPVRILDGGSGEDTISSSGGDREGLHPRRRARHNLLRQ